MEKINNNILEFYFWHLGFVGELFGGGERHGASQASLLAVPMDS